MNEKEIQNIKQKFGIIGNAPILNLAIQKAIMVSNTDMTVLIKGESGTGKESFSKIIHNLSTRKHGPFFVINCGALPEGTIDSELFGHEKGAFTGASESRKGYFETSNKGTIFLDEIGEMPAQTQTRLLRILEYGEFVRLGSSKVQKTDVRIVAATHVNLVKAVEEGKFREDLYYRLNTVPIDIPPLRERGDDIHLLFRKFVTDASDTYKSDLVKLAPDAIALLNKYSFPGNIRQLKNIAQQLSVFEAGNILNAEGLSRYLPNNQRHLPMLIKNQSNSGTSDFSERDILYKILFDLKAEVSDLKGLVRHILNDKSIDETQIPKDYSSLLSVGSSRQQQDEQFDYQEEKASNSYLIPRKNESDQEGFYHKVEDITDLNEEESLSLEKKEKELIIKALKKNANKRKYAAIDLGISERTLYRKIKQYGLE